MHPAPRDSATALSELVSALVRTREPDARAALAARVRAAGPAAALAALACALGEDPVASHDARAAYDLVCAQHLAHDSRLFWFTDLSAALREARATGRAVLSLRLLGRLDAPLSCANSRLFRVTLYPDAGVAALMRERFVLHWHAVRPVPVATVDFGDGRRLVQPITGNSAHYALDAEGRLVDCIPGAYDARAFERALRWSAAAAQASVTAPDRASALRAMHKYRLEELFVEWTRALHAAGQGALARMGLATLKRTARINDALARLEAGSDDAVWSALAARRSPRVRFGELAERMAPGEPSGARRAARRARSKLAMERPLLDALAHTIADDTARNEFVLHRAVHERFVRGRMDDDLADVDRWLYAELFDAPLDDPWMGLAPAAFTALEHAGLVEPAPAAPATPARG